MLKEYFKKVFNPASAETQEEDVSMTTETQAAVVANEASTKVIATLTAQLATVTEQLTTLQSQLAEVSAKAEAAQAALDASEAAQAALAAQAVEKRLQERTKAVEAAVGTEAAPALLAATEDLSDEKFNTIVSAMAASADKEATTDAFKEVGASAETPTPVVEVDAVQKLADSIAAKFKTN